MSNPYGHPQLVSQQPPRSHTLPSGISSPTRQLSNSNTRNATPAGPSKKARKRSSFSEHTAVDPSQDVTKVRAYSACRSCRVKKIRCLPGPSNGVVGENGGLVPGTCQQCIQGGIECTYPPSRDRAAYSRQYVQNLESRVQALEAVQNRILPLLDAFEHNHNILPLASNQIKRDKSNKNDDDQGVNNQVGVEDPTHGTESEGERDSQEEENMHHSSHSDVEDGGQMTQDERGNYRYIGSSNTLSLLDSFSHRDRENHKDKEMEFPNQAGIISRSNSFALKSNNQLSDPNSRHSPAISDQTATTRTNPYFGHVAGSGVVKALPPVHEVQYPPPDEAQKMIDAYFLEVHPSLPVVLEHEFRKEFKEVMDTRARGALPTQGTFLAVVFAMFALGERVLDHEDTVLPGEAEAGVIWFERAQILHYTCLKDLNIKQVQCLTLMAAFQASVNAMPMSWLLAGQALRVAQDLGLHRSTSRLPIPFAEKQLRSRCWWAIYGLERMMSISLGRPLGVDDLDIDVAYPAEIDDEGLERMSYESTPSSALSSVEEALGSTMSGFIALTKLCKIAGKVAHLLYRPSNEKSVSDPSWAASQQTAINKVDKMLRDWLDHDVPSKYKDPSDNRAVSLISAILSNSYFAILITLHRNFLPSNPDYPRPKPPPSSQSLARCVEAARSVIHIASQSRTLVPPSHHLAVYCQYLWSSAVILLLCEVQAKEQLVIETVGSHVESCRRTLQSLEPVWPGSRKLKELLNDVASRAKEVAQTTKVNSKSKKRKPTSNLEKLQHNNNGQMRPPPSRNHSSSASPHRPNHGPTTNPTKSTGTYQDSTSSPTFVVPSGSVGGSSDKRQRTYETSDTRTMINSEDRQGQQQSQQNPSITQVQYYNIPTYPSNAPTPNTLPPDQNNGNPLNQLDIESYNFDLGGVTFNPSELLQGFSEPSSNFWNQMTFVDNGNLNSNSSYNNQNQVFSGQNTPNSTSGSGVSPGMIPQNQSNVLSSQQNTGITNNSSGTGNSSGSYTPNSGGVNTLDPFSEFWSQVAGNSFDWQADPSVPFNI
uniref:Zn(2)-C6 fungal-type domain-containing protein n=1 Tax=Kwoniella pini CBS 10737 TaxID=1296096 RepID=A0A1B9I0M1_9TREE|nr:uncharacterized protein I206_04688 [Kwoniella pini CBS 10737]OCF49001.1 hypothetical protein I206_04688 [Kwoniella pini CBS 10737]